MRIIPTNTNVETELFKGIGFLDALVGLIGICITSLAFLSNIRFKFVLTVIFGMMTIIMLCDMDDDKTYLFIYNVIKYYVRPKIFIKRLKRKSKSDAKDLNVEKEIVVEANEGASNQVDHSKNGEVLAKKMKNGQDKKTDKESVKSDDLDIYDIVPFTSINDDVIFYGEKYEAAVIEISSVEFKFYTEYKQNHIIDKVLGAIVRTISGSESASFVKIDRPVIYDHYINVELEKIEELKKAFKNGLINQIELDERIKIIDARISDIENLNKQEKVVKPFHYLIFYEKDHTLLEDIIRNTLEQLKENDIPVKRLNTKELAVFLKYTYGYDFDEREADTLTPDEYMNWIVPNKIEFTSRSVKFDEKLFYNFRISGYPILVTNAWGHTLFNIPNTKVTMKIRAVEKYKAVRAIDRSIDELRSQQYKTSKTSKIIDLATQADVLAELLILLNNGNEILYDVSIYVSVYDYVHAEEIKDNKAMSDGHTEKKVSSDELQKKQKDSKFVNANKGAAKKYVKRMLNEADFKVSEMFLQQLEAYAGGHISGYDPFPKKGQKMPSGSAAAVFPFVYPGWLDPKGFKLGTKDKIPVFLDFFVRDSSRVNSNMVIIGKSGSGKSFSTKTILTNLASDDTKIFVLDPENEYRGIANKMHGKLIDVGSAKEGRMNPFHIITSLSDEEESSGDTKNVSLSVHLQFLEEFFRQILPGIESDAREYLNNLLIATYEQRGINEDTNLSELTASDFPIFDDLYEKILSDFQTATGEYSKNNLRILLNYISKFASGGRNSNLWNGESTITTNENFIVFNFQSLLANKNNTIANAQMLLVLKWLDNEIIKNRDYNIKYSTNRKIIVVIDEAHVFIDEKFPIALDFMFQLAKRIRKYSGMQIIITQNIKDFVGTEEIARKSTAIINACQYSFIFPLAPNDMDDLCRLYEKAGAINKSEQEQIINNGRGNAFVILSPTNRTNVKIVAPKKIQELFE